MNPLANYRVLGVLTLIAFGVARQPVEEELRSDLRAANFRAGKVDLSMREHVSQTMFAAALGGFQSLVGTMMYLETSTYWRYCQWGKLDRQFRAITTLQPREELYWDMASYHMAYNARLHYLDDLRREDQTLRTEAEKYLERGIQYARDGLRQLPKSHRLYRSLAGYYERLKKDYCSAAKYYALASQQEGALPYLERAAAFSLARCPGSEREAYETLMRLYADESNRVPTLIILIKDLEEFFHIAPEQRIKDEVNLRNQRPSARQ